MFVRQVEVYKASHPGRLVHLYLLSLDESAEESRFRYASHHEKDAFKTLIRKRSTMSSVVMDDGIAGKGDNKKAGDINNDTNLQQMQFTQEMLTANSTSSSWSKRRGLGDGYDSRRKGCTKQGPAMFCHGVDKGVVGVGGQTAMSLNYTGQDGPRCP